MAVNRRASFAAFSDCQQWDIHKDFTKHRLWNPGCMELTCSNSPFRSTEGGPSVPTIVLRGNGCCKGDPPKMDRVPQHPILLTTPSTSTPTMNRAEVRVLCGLVGLTAGGGRVVAVLAL